MIQQSPDLKGLALHVIQQHPVGLGQRVIQQHPSAKGFEPILGVYQQNVQNLKTTKDHLGRVEKVSIYIYRKESHEKDKHTEDRLRKKLLTSASRLSAIHGTRGHKVRYTSRPYTRMRQALHEEIAYTVLQQSNLYCDSEAKCWGLRMNEIQHIPHTASHTTASNYKDNT